MAQNGNAHRHLLRQLTPRHRRIIEAALGKGRAKPLGQLGRTRVLGIRPEHRVDKRHVLNRRDTLNLICYDYERNQPFEMSVDPAAKEIISKRKLRHQPTPSYDEFAQAVQILSQDERFRRALRKKTLLPYRAMPPLLENARGRPVQERTLNVGLLPNGPGPQHRIVSVNLSRREVLARPGPPPRSAASSTVCPGNLPPAASCAPTSRQTRPPLRLKWPAQSPVWELQVLAPRASHGTNGSGIELLDVHYKGRRILAQAHVPILNVKYNASACGPFRDWLFAETCFQAEGTPLADHPEFIRCASAPKTICEAGTDDGNFTGVAIYEDRNELVLVSECEAGWYRYIPEWRLHKNGTIRPMFKFSAVSNSCVCNVHVHHAYWRFDFAIDTPGVPDEHAVEYFDGSTWKLIRKEVRQYRDALHRGWRVSNTRTRHGYQIVPGPNDGSAKGDAYGKGDVWVLRWHSNELDDGISTHPNSDAKLDRFVNGEDVYRQDIVLWYAAHFEHHIDPNEPTECHVVGPTLRPVRLT